MRDFPTPTPQDIDADITSAEDLHQQLAAAIAEAEKTGDFTKAEEIKMLLQDKIGALKEETERRESIFTEMFEGQEISIDIRDISKISEEFYNDHDLSEFNDNYPANIRFSPEGNERIREALRMGFDRAMIMPPAKVQECYLGAVIEQTASQPCAELSEAEQYSPPTINLIGDLYKTHNRPAKAYLLMYQSSPIPLETKAKNSLELEELFKSKKWDGMTQSEYLLQRREAEERKNHSFDERSVDDFTSQYTWLLDSRLSESVSLCGGWNGINKQIDLSGVSRAWSSDKLGARPTVVVEIL